MRRHRHTEIYEVTLPFGTRLTVDLPESLGLGEALNAAGVPYTCRPVHHFRYRRVLA